MPWLNGERSPVEDKVVRAGWLNLSLRTDRAMLVRSVLEGVAYNSRWLFDAYEKFLKRPVPKVRILGGGAQSDLWCQIYADVLGRPVEQVADPRHAQLRGVALWARVCLGELTLDDDARARARGGDVHAVGRPRRILRRLRRVPQALRQAQGALPPAERERSRRRLERRGQRAADEAPADPADGAAVASRPLNSSIATVRPKSSASRSKAGTGSRRMAGSVRTIQGSRPAACRTARRR